MALSPDEIFAKVREALVGALGVDEEQVTAEATLGPDLGAESIDYLDIGFRLEKAFGLKIPRGDLVPDNIFSDEKYVQNGKLTPDGLAELKRRMPYAEMGEFEKDPDVQKVENLVTVGMICKYIEAKLNGAAA
jgi:acyl carrier protein